MPDPALSATEQQQREYYNSIADEYDRHYHHPYSMAYRSMVFDQVFKKIDLQGKRVLDAMCGGGENSSYLVHKGAQVHGLDISDRQCEIYHKRFPDHPVHCRSALATGFEDNAFDLVVTESLHHLPPHVNAGVTEFHRILKPGGWFLFWEPASGSLLDLMRKLWYRLDRKYFEDNEQSIDAKALIKDFDRHFERISLTYGGNVAHLFVQSSMIFRIPLWLVRIYAKPCLVLERCLQPLQGKFNSCWVMGLLQKRPSLPQQAS